MQTLPNPVVGPRTEVVLSQSTCAHRSKEEECDLIHPVSSTFPLLLLVLLWQSAMAQAAGLLSVGIARIKVHQASAGLSKESAVHGTPKSTLGVRVLVSQLVDTILEVRSRNQLESRIVRWIIIVPRCTVIGLVW